MSQIEIKVPDIGDFKEVKVIELLVKVGDVVKPEQSLITVESDKASMEIPSSHAGIVKELKVKIGDKVAMGSLLLMLVLVRSLQSITLRTKSCSTGRWSSGLQLTTKVVCVLRSTSVRSQKKFLQRLQNNT